MHLTPNYIQNKFESNKLYGPLRNVLVHEWAHLRYGVFDENPTKPDESNFYFNTNNEIDAIRCSTNIKGKLRDPFMPNGTCTSYLPSGLPDPVCIFEDDIRQHNLKRQIGSLMYKPFLTQVSKYKPVLLDGQTQVKFDLLFFFKMNSFCDNDPTNPATLHNSVAPNLQNKLCNGKSIWEVSPWRQQNTHTHQDNQSMAYFVIY
jgi:calcium-activated chloride channel regulator 4